MAETIMIIYILLYYKYKNLIYDYYITTDITKNRSIYLTTSKKN